MNKLIKVTTNENNERLVSGRELYEFLEVKDNYTDWFKRMIGYGFTENVDFSTLSEKSDKPFGGRPKVNHAVSLDMAKEVSMIQRTEKGKQARQYFVQVEKEYKQQLDTSNLSPELQLMNSMLRQMARQELENKRIESKVDSISSIVRMDTKDWRKNANNILRKIAIKQGGFDKFKEIGNESYQMLELRAKCDLDRRLENRRKNMIVQGVGKTTVKRFNKLDVIAEDARLTEIYLSVIKDMAIKYKVDFDEVI